MKRTVIMLLVVLAASLWGCAQEPASTTPTGYPADEVQFLALCYDGQLYRYDANGFDQPLPEGFQLAGQVQAVNNRELPEDDFCAAHLDIGQQIYAQEGNGDLVYVAFDSGYAAFQIPS